MPSSNKTLHLQLNKWAGGDKPKMDDFNADNQVVDDACAALSDAVAQVAQTAQAHAADTAHIAPAERTAWNAKDKFVLGSYTGNGASSRKITLEFAPRFGMLYGIGQAVVRSDWDNDNNNNYVGFFSSSGSSEGIVADSSGFTVTNHAAPRPNGHTLKQNENGVTYIYIAWQ